MASLINVLDDTSQQNIRELFIEYIRCIRIEVLEFIIEFQKPINSKRNGDYRMGNNIHRSEKKTSTKTMTNNYRLKNLELFHLPSEWIRNDRQQRQIHLMHDCQWNFHLMKWTQTENLFVPSSSTQRSGNQLNSHLERCYDSERPIEPTIWSATPCTLSAFGTLDVEAISIVTATSDVVDSRLAFPTGESSCSLGRKIFLWPKPRWICNNGSMRNVRWKKFKSTKMRLIAITFPPRFPHFVHSAKCPWRCSEKNGVNTSCSTPA